MASDVERFWLEKSAEGHPYNIFTCGYGTDNSIPDKKWVMWMVDALNEKINKK